MQRISDVLGRIATWLVLSSKDSTKLSMTVKSAFVGVLTVAGALHFPLEALTSLQEATLNLIDVGVALLAALGVFIGAFRKVKSTLAGTNAVLNDPIFR